LPPTHCAEIRAKDAAQALTDFGSGTVGKRVIVID